MIYLQTTADFGNGTHDWDNPSQSFKVMLLNASYTPDSSHVYVSSLAPYEVSGTNYNPGFGNTGRKALTSRLVTVNSSSNLTNYSAANVFFGSINVGQIKYVAIIREITNDSDSKCLYLISGGGLPQTTVGGDLSINWPSSGIFTISGRG